MAREQVVAWLRGLPHAERLSIVASVMAAEPVIASKAGPLRPTIRPPARPELQVISTFDLDVVEPDVPASISADETAEVPEAVVAGAETLAGMARDLRFMETAVEGGSVCLAALFQVVPCKAALLHLYDEEAQEFVVVYAQGPSAERMLLTRTAATDGMLATAVADRQSLAVSYDVGDPTLPQRYSFFGAKQAVLVTPVQSEDRVFGVFELIDPKAGVFDADADAAVCFVADSYAAFLQERGVQFNRVVAPPSGFVCAMCDAGDFDHTCLEATG